MKSIIKFFFGGLIPALLIFMHLTSGITQDKKKTEEKPQQDSIKQNRTIELLRINDSIRTADSIAKSELQKQIESLKSNELAKKKELEQKLQDIAGKDSLRKARLRNEIDSLKKFNTGIPVTLSKDTLFFIYNKIGSFTANDRAEFISKRIHKFAIDPLYNTDSIKTERNELTTDIIYENLIIMSITDVDALWHEMNRDELAQIYKEKITESVKAYRDESNIFNIAKNIGLTLLVIILLYIILRTINRLFRKLKYLIIRHRSLWAKGITIFNYKLLDDENEVRTAFFILRILKYVIMLAVLYLSLPIIFGIFPATESISKKLFGYIVNPFKSVIFSIIDYLPNLFTIIVIVIITRFVVKALRKLSHDVETEKIKFKGFYPDWSHPTFNIVRFLLYAFMFIIIFPYLPGSDSAVFQGVSIFLGVLFSLGSTSAIGNIIAGLVITYMRPFRAGDRVKIGEVTGDVIEKTLFVTKLKTPKNEYVTIPNLTILNSHTVNYNTSTSESGLIVHSTVTIGYDAQWRKVHELLISAALSTSHILKEPKPFVLQTELNDFYVSYQINAYTRKANMQPRIYSELHQNIQDKFNEAGVEIMSPHYNSLRDGNPSAIPDKYKPDDYVPPAFKIKKDNDK